MYFFLGSPLKNHLCLNQQSWRSFSYILPLLADVPLAHLAPAPVPRVARFEKASLLGIFEHFTRQKFLVNLPVIHLFFDRPRGDESINRDFFLLTNTPRAFARLRIRRRVPVGIVQQHAIRPGEIYAQTADFGGEQKHKHASVVVVEVIDERHARSDRRVSIHSAVIVPSRRHCALQDIEHLLRLAEHEASVTLLAPK